MAIVSYFWTAVFWDGAFPSGEYHLKILNKAGDSIEGATINIYYESDLSFGYPFDNYLSENSLISDDRGEIVLTHFPRGVEFGSSGWDLFWIIPIGYSPPTFTCQINAAGYKLYNFSSVDIFETAYNTYGNDKIPSKTILINGNEYKLRILEKTIVLKEK